MTLENPETHLPDVLRDSKLPWLPDDPLQARAPGPHDGWTATLGALQLRLMVETWEEEPSSFELRLVNTVSDREISCWTLPSLPDAALVAHSVLQMRLDDLLLHVRRRLHAAA
jgi:hypothetical protein